jgi:hypothetical protein
VDNRLRSQRASPKVFRALRRTIIASAVLLHSLSMKFYRTSMTLVRMNNIVGTLHDIDNENDALTATPSSTPLTPKIALLVCSI